MLITIQDKKLWTQGSQAAYDQKMMAYQKCTYGRFYSLFVSLERGEALAR